MDTPGARGDNVERPFGAEGDSSYSNPSEADQGAHAEYPPEESASTANDPYETADQASPEVAESTADYPTETEGQELPAVYSVSGRVLSNEGHALPGVGVIASATRLYYDDGSARSANLPPRRTTSDAFGLYRFEGLPDGEYMIMTVRTPQYPVARIFVRAGIDYADLVIVTQRVVQVFGTIINTVSEVVPAANITAWAPDPFSTRSDANGHYELSFQLPDNATSFPVRISRDGYEILEFVVTQQEWEMSYQIPRDVTLRPIATSTDVMGTLRGTDGNPVVGELVSLFCPADLRTYEAVSGGDGSFLLRDVVMSNNCKLSINPKGPYEQYFNANFSVTADLSADIILTKHNRGGVAGRMTDLFGNPLPNYSLVLRSLVSNRSVQVQSDTQGFFLVDDLPEGEVVFERRPMPNFAIKGVRVSAGTRVNAAVVLDVGSYQIRGRVIDSAGNPLTVPKITLTWTHTSNSIESSSRRATSADAYGEFSFSGLGPGKHSVYVEAPGFKPLWSDHDPAQQGPDVDLQLEAM